MARFPRHAWFCQECCQSQYIDWKTQFRENDIIFQEYNQGERIVTPQDYQLLLENVKSQFSKSSTSIHKKIDIKAYLNHLTTKNTVSDIQNNTNEHLEIDSEKKRKFGNCNNNSSNSSSSSVIKNNNNVNSNIKQLRTPDNSLFQDLSNTNTPISHASSSSTILRTTTNTTNTAAGVSSSSSTTNQNPNTPTTQIIDIHNSEKAEDDKCFVCSEAGVLLICDFPLCTRVYHKVSY